MCLLFNSFLSKKQLSSNVMAEVTIHSDFRDKEEEIITASTFPPPICQEGLGPDLRFLFFVLWVFFLILNFKPTFSLSSFMLINSLFSSSSLYAIRVVSLMYLKLVIFLLANLIPACNLSSPAFLLMCSEYKLNEQDDNNRLLLLLSQSWTSQFFHTGF